MKNKLMTAQINSYLLSDDIVLRIIDSMLAKAGSDLSSAYTNESLTLYMQQVAQIRDFVNGLEANKGIK